MSGIIYVREGLSSSSFVQKTRDSWVKVFLAKGMTLDREIAAPGSLLLTFRRTDDDIDRFASMDQENYLTYSGTLIYKGRTGVQALAGIYEYYSEFKQFPADIKGNYALFLSTAQELIITTDDVGLYKLYTSKDHKILSTSLLAVRKSIDSVNISKQELYEYMLCGTSYGNQTPIDEIRTLDNQFLYKFQGSNFTKIAKTISARERVAPVGLKNGLQECSDTLLDLFEDLKSAYGNKMSLPITGGFDSRLICACAHKVGIHPEYTFVLHKDHQQDVDIARQISKRYNWNLTTLDNQFPDWADDESQDILKDMYYKYDGMGVGGVFQYFSGLDAFSRIPHNKVLLDGNGGEIFRNTYRLPNRALSLPAYSKKTVLKHLSTLDQPRLDKDIFVANLCAKIEEQEKLSSSTVDRGLLESLYPKFIQKHWLGLFSSTANQFMDFFAPFLDMKVINSSLTIPFRYKTMGLFESELIKYIDPQVAKLNSNYGYNFYDGLNAKRLTTERCAITLSNSMLFKRFKHMIPKKRKTNLPHYAKSGFFQKLREFEPNLLAMLGTNMSSEQFVDAGRITIAVQLSRLYSIELLLEDAL